MKQSWDLRAAASRSLETSPAESQLSTSRLAFYGAPQVLWLLMLAVITLSEEEQSITSITTLLVMTDRSALNIAHDLFAVLSNLATETS